MVAVAVAVNAVAERKSVFKSIVSDVVRSRKKDDCGGCVNNADVELGPLMGERDLYMNSHADLQRARFRTYYIRISSATTS